jgi:hypothetical protein
VCSNSMPLGCSLSYRWNHNLVATLTGLSECKMVFNARETFIQEMVDVTVLSGGGDHLL